MDTQQTQIKKLEAAVARLEKVVQMLATRVRALEIDNKKVRSSVSRAHMQLGQHDRQLTSRG